MPEYPLRLATVEFAALWARVSEAASPIGSLRFGATAADKARIHAVCSAQLAHRGLGTLEHPHPDLADLVDVLAHPAASIDIDLAFAGGSGRATVAETRTATAALTWDGAEAHLWWARPGTAVDTAVSVLPPLPAGPGRSATLRRADYDAACAQRSPIAFLGVLRDAGIREPEAHTALAAATGHTGNGRATVDRRPDPVTWVDTAEGRYLLRPAGDWLTIVPADHARLASAMADLR
ncbi:ESX secretion-associated protein EspG [Actinokineospora guangxiensis]|uniref:ESX secretion-associated protein EspG n=1 Tax=Actinokineospora guangxiensis TaxID=1490288 RepID=A0ABW0EX71_9PSEU